MLDISGGGVCRSARSFARGLGDLVIVKSANDDLFGDVERGLVIGDSGFDATGPLGFDGELGLDAGLEPELVLGEAGFDGI